MKDLNLQLDAILLKHQEIEKKLSKQDQLTTHKLIELNKEYSELIPIVEIIKKYNETNNDLKNLKELLDDDDESIRLIAEEEIIQANSNLTIIESDLLKSLIPKDLNDEKNSILEIRAGTGGDEASLFAADLLSMYRKYSDLNSWKFAFLQ